jgi:beta-glucosidase
MALGLSSQLEGEEMTVREPGFLGGDRTDINLPARQQKLLEAVGATGKTDRAGVIEWQRDRS